MVKTDLYRASFLVGAASRPFGPPALCSGPLNAGVAWIPIFGRINGIWCDLLFGMFLDVG